MSLLETPQAVENLYSILAVSGIDYVHVGLNDLHLGYGLRFMFELLANGTVERICNRVKQRGYPSGLEAATWTRHFTCRVNSCRTLPFGF